MKMRSDDLTVRPKGKLFLKKNNKLPINTPLGKPPSEILVECKARACKILAKNYLMIQQGFRRGVAKYKGSTYGIGFKSLRNTQSMVWGARVKRLNCNNAAAVHGQDGILIDDRQKLYPVILTDILVHEALHYWCTLKGRWLGSTLDHLCMQELGAVTEPDATLVIAIRRYPLAKMV